MKTNFMHFNSFRENRSFVLQYGRKPPYISNDFVDFKTLLETTQDYFVFILTTEQFSLWKEMEKKYGYAEYLHFMQSGWSVNENYPYKGARLKLFVLKGKGNENQTGV